MTTQDLTLMQAAIQKMHWNEARQKVLSQNIANADTPGYKPQDIAPLNFKELLESSASKLSLEVATTDPKHLGLNGSAPGKFAAKAGKNPYGTSPSGNAVVLEEQLLKMSQNDLDHKLTSTIYQKNMDMLKAALRTQ